MNPDPLLYSLVFGESMLNDVSVLSCIILSYPVLSYSVLFCPVLYCPAFANAVRTTKFFNWFWFVLFQAVAIVLFRYFYSLTHHSIETLAHASTNAYKHAHPTYHTTTTLDGDLPLHWHFVPRTFSGYVGGEAFTAGSLPPVIEQFLYTYKYTLTNTTTADRIYKQAHTASHVHDKQMLLKFTGVMLGSAAIGLVVGLFSSFISLHFLSVFH